MRFVDFARMIIGVSILVTGGAFILSAVGMVMGPIPDERWDERMAMGMILWGLWRVAPVWTYNARRGGWEPS